jgi:hypothetical protein
MKMKRIPLLASTLSVALTTSLLLPAIGAILASIPDRANLGQNVTVTIKTEPKSQCKLEAQGIPAMLATETSNKNGVASWTFRINRDYKADRLPLVFTCDKNGKEEKLVSTIPIARQTRMGAAIPVLHLVFAPASAARGQQVKVVVQSTPGAKLKIEAQDAGISQMFALADKRADSKGQAAWTFRIGKGYKANVMPVIVTADRKGAQEKLVTAIEVGTKMAATARPRLY